MTETSRSGSSGYTALIGDVLELLSQPGTWMDATQRIAVAGVVRGISPAQDLSDSATEAARRMAHKPTTVTGEWIAELEQSGLGRPALAEILAVVSRQVAIDTFMFGVGAELTALPLASDAPPSLMKVPDATLNNGWLPTVGPASPHTAFTSVPPEQDALRQLHAGFYLPMSEISDFSYERDGLSRPQMELIAARTSHLNECVYGLVSHARMLRASAKKHSLEVNLSGVGDFTIDSGVPVGAELIALTDAVVLRDADELEFARTAAADQLGVAATVRAIAVASNFTMMNIIMDALGTRPSGDPSDVAF